MQQHLFEHFNNEGHYCFLEKFLSHSLTKQIHQNLYKKKIIGGVSLRLWHHGISMPRKVFEFSLFSRYVLLRQSLFDINWMVMGGLLIMIHG